MIFTNDFTKDKVRKSDIATGEPVIGAVLQIFPVGEDGTVAEKPVLEWVSAAEDFYFERLPQGDYSCGRALRARAPSRKSEILTSSLR